MTGRFRVDVVGGLIVVEQEGFFTTPVGLAFVDRLAEAFQHATAAEPCADFLVELRAFEGCTVAYQVRFEEFMRGAAPLTGAIAVVAPSPAALVVVARSEPFVPGVRLHPAADVDDALVRLGRAHLAPAVHAVRAAARWSSAAPEPDAP